MNTPNSNAGMKSGVYYKRRTDRPDLQNQRGLLRDDPDNPDNYLVQFNQLDLFEAHGWHSFPRRDFINVYTLGKK